MVLLELLLPMVAAAGWLWWLQYMDRFEKEPWELVLKTFALSAAAGLVGLFALLAAALKLPEDGTLILVLIGLVPLHVLAMAGVIWLLPYRRPEWKEPFDGLVYGGAAGIGYGLTYTLWLLVEPGTLGFRSAVFSIPVYMLSGLIIGHHMSQVRFGPRRTAGVWIAGLAKAALFLMGIELAESFGGLVLGSDNPVASVVAYAANTVGWLIAMWAMDVDRKASPYDPANYRFQLAPYGCPSCGSAYPTGSLYCNRCGQPVAGQWEGQR